MPASVHWRAVGQGGLGSSATQLMRAVRCSLECKVVTDNSHDWLVVQNDRRDSSALGDELDGHSALLRACRQGDIAAVATLLAEGPAAIHETGHMGRTPLHVAAEHDNLRLAELLLQSGARIEARRTREDTPLFWASSQPMAAFLIEAGADPHAKDFAGREPIHWAAQFARYDVLQYFLSLGCSANTVDRHLNAPMHYVTGAAGLINVFWMVAPQAVDCIDLLIRYGANVNAQNRDGNVPLLSITKLPPETSSVQQIDLARLWRAIRLLVEHGADATIANESGISPLSRASESIRGLLESLSNMDMQGGEKGD